MQHLVQRSRLDRVEELLEPESLFERYRLEGTIGGGGGHSEGEDGEQHTTEDNVL